MTVFAYIAAFLFESARLELIAKQFGFTIEQLEGMLPADPTGGKYLTWIAKQVKLGQLRFPEDQQKVHQRLVQFDHLKRKPQFPDAKDLNQYKTYSQLAQTIEANLGIQTKGEVRRQKVTDGAKLLKEWDTAGKHLAVYEITTFEAIDAMGAQQTDWCVKDEKYFNDYGPPFYLLTSNGKPSKLLHLNSSQCMDKWDAPTGFAEFEQAGIDLDNLYTWEYLMGQVANTGLANRQALFEKALTLMKDGILTFEIEHIIELIEEGGAGQEMNAVGSWDRTNGWRELEQTLIETVLARYPDRMIQGIGHKALATYCSRVLKSRWKEAEDTMLLPSQNKAGQNCGIYWYTVSVLRADNKNSWGSKQATNGGPQPSTRWEEAEPILIQNCFYVTKEKDSPVWWAVMYSTNAMRMRWPALEETFLKLLGAEHDEYDTQDLELIDAIDAYNDKWYVNARELRVPFPTTRYDALQMGLMKPDGNGGFVYGLHVIEK